MLGDDADEQVVRCGYPVACPEDRDLKWTLRSDVSISPSEFALLKVAWREPVSWMLWFCCQKSRR